MRSSQSGSGGAGRRSTRPCKHARANETMALSFRALALVFPTEESLRAALKAGLVPPDVQRGAVRVGRTADGQLELQPGEAMSAIAKAALKNVGVSERDASAVAASAPCWAAALKPTWVGEPDTVPGVVLF